MLSTPAHSVATRVMERMDVLETELQRVITPYVYSAWENALSAAKLSLKYPNLVHDLRYGSPIGNPPPLTETFIPPNMPSAYQFPSIISSSLAEEVAANRVSGPFTVLEAHMIFKGHFRTAPLGLVEKEPGSGELRKKQPDPSQLRMIRNHSACDPRGVSTNDWLDTHAEPTTWYSCAQMADVVSYIRSPSFFSISLLLCRVERRSAYTVTCCVERSSASTVLC
jgi:hypothetical protein